MISRKMWSLTCQEGMSRRVLANARAQIGFNKLAEVRPVDLYQQLKATELFPMLITR